jgi:hypothetical protein
MHLEDDANFSGWTQSHPCVSAVILFTLLSANRKSDRIRIHMLVTFLLGHLENKRSLAYWWTSEIYTLFWLVQCCRFEVVCSLKEKVVERINLCFYEFNQPTSVGHSVEFHTPFYIAMLVRCACELRTEVNAPEFESIARSLVGRLLSLQYEDGSWDGGDALQIPEPNCIDPEFALYPVSPHGCSVRAPEYNRLFSTAVAVNALHQFRKVYA